MSTLENHTTQQIQPHHKSQVKTALSFTLSRVAAREVGERSVMPTSCATRTTTCDGTTVVLALLSSLPSLLPSLLNLSLFSQIWVLFGIWVYFS